VVKIGKYLPKINKVPHYWEGGSPPDGWLVAIAGQNRGHWRGRLNTV